MSNVVSPNVLRVGVPIPIVHPTAGGGFEFQQTVFAEILKRVNASPGSLDSEVQFIPIATTSNSALNWGIDPQNVLSVFPSRSLRLRSTLHRHLRRFRHPCRPQLWQNSLAGRAAVHKLSGKIHAIWSLHPGIQVDQLPFVVTVWDLQHRLQPFFPEVSRSGEWETRELGYSVLARKAFLNVVGTNRGEDELQRFYGIDPSRVLVNPFPCPPPLQLADAEADMLLKKFSLSPGQFLLYPAQFWAHKNHLALLQALRLLVDQGHRLKLVLTGSDKGVLSAVERHIDRLDLRTWVVNAGFVDRADLAALYAHCFALVYPSFFGPDNIPPLEAMSYKVPALVADVPGAREQYGDAALCFNPAQPAQIAACINRLFDENGLRERLIFNGSSLVARLTPEAYVDRLIAFFVENSLQLQCAALGL